MCHGEEPGARAEGVSNHRTRQQASCAYRVVLRDDFVATKSPQDDTRFTIFLIKKDPRTYRTVRGSLRGDKISIGRLFRSIKMK